LKDTTRLEKHQTIQNELKQKVNVKIHTRQKLYFL
jgi:hypothetical protein